MTNPPLDVRKRLTASSLQGGQEDEVAAVQLRARLRVFCFCSFVCGPANLKILSLRGFFAFYIFIYLFIQHIC